MKMLENKKALVTGSSRGIGRKIAEVFISNGCEVWGLCTKPSKAKEDLEKLAAENGVKFHELNCNCADFAALQECIKKALEEADGFDILVNNAGITRDGLSFAMPMENWKDVIDVNLTAPFLINQIISYDMIHRKKGSIINMTSISGVHGEAGQVNYSASKAGLIGMTKALAKEIGKRKVRVNAVAPGFIETEMTEAVPEELRKEWVKIIPMNRAGQVEEVANVCLFLASDLSTYVTGQVIGVDGGMGA